MSRIGKLPINFHKSLKVSISGNSLIFENGKDSVEYKLSVSVSAKIENDKIILLPNNPNSKIHSSMEMGMNRSNIKNIVQGLENPFKTILEVNGVGYKVLVDKNLLVLTLGYSHEIYYKLPKGVNAVFEKPNLLILSSHDKILLGQSSSEIISFRKTEPYKGKGIKISGRKILRKEGKKK